MDVCHLIKSKTVKENNFLAIKTNDPNAGGFGAV